MSAFIHPLVHDFVGASQIVPVIIQMKTDKLDTFVNKISSVQISSGGVLSRFGMVATLATKKDLKIYKDLPYVGSIGLNDVHYANEFRAYGAFKSIYIGTAESRKYIGADLAQQQGLTGKGIKVSVLDTGIFRLHPQFSPSVEEISALVPEPLGADLFGFKPDALKPLTSKGMLGGFDDNGHGSHCLSTVGGRKLRAPSGIDVMGVAPDSSLTSIKVLGTPMGIGMSSDIIRGIDIALSKGSDVISMSLGSKSGDNSTPACLAIKMASIAYPKTVFVIAAGNFGPDRETIGSPGCSVEALTVGSISMVDGDVSHFSSRGPTADGFMKPDVLAPGGGRMIRPEDGKYEEFIYSGTSPGTVLDISDDAMADGYAGLSGTSMATPHVAGLVAILKQKNRAIDTNYIKSVMEAKNIKNNESGWGILHYKDFEGENDG